MLGSAPEMILTNAKVMTMDPARPRAEAVAIAGRRVLKLGNRAEIEALAGAGSRIIDAGGRTVLPGFVESHLHLGMGGQEMTHLQLGGVEGIGALKRAFQAFAAGRPDQPLLMAQGADYAMLGRPITRVDLDRVMPDRPIALTAHDHHTVWANTVALQGAGILGGLKTPPGHEVVMGADGLATGELREFEAFAPIIALAGSMNLNLGIATGEEPAPWPDAGARAIDRAHFVRGLGHCARHGVTSMVMMDGNRYTLEILRELQKEGGLSARVKVPFHYKPHMELSVLERAEAMRADFSDDWLQAGFVKMFMDGVVESGTAYMLNDYPSQPGHRSEPLFSAARFNEIACEIDRRGLQIAVHAVGDGAVRTVIDGYEAAQRANGVRDSRHRIEHIELIDRDDISRLGALGIVASLQPAHPPGSMDFPLFPTLDMIARSRWRDSYLCRTLVEAGAPLAFASDWPVADISVLRGIKAALTRKPYDASCAEERLDLESTLKAYTAGGAWAAHRENLVGRLAPDMAGDLVMLSGNIEAVTPEEINEFDVALTVADGQITHEAALLHKSGEGRSPPYPRRTYPTGSVTGMPRAV